MNQFLDKLINHYKLSNEEFLEWTKPLSEIKLRDPKLIKGMDKTVDRIHKAIENNEKIIIYGDFDCDGVTSTSILYKTFLKLNYKVDYFIPSRYKDGYGLTLENTEKIAKKDFKLIILVDNGITCFEQIDKANELGMDVIVIDHHELQDDKTPNAYSIIHPSVSNINTIFGSGGLMALFVSSALLGYYDDYLLTLAGLSLISDLMALKGENREFVRLALENYKNNKYLPLALLADNQDIVNEKTFSLEIAPKINAVGRLKEDTSINHLVEYLTTDDKKRILTISQWIININDERKELTSEIAKNLPKFDGQQGIACVLNIKDGLLGLVANRLLSQYKVPTIIFTKDSNEPELLRGSARSKEGFNIMKCYESLSDLIVKSGGHALAGGITIKEKDFDEFNRRFVSLCETFPITEQEKPSIEISLSDINFDNYEVLRLFAPFGMGNDEPLFKLKDISTRSLTFIRGQTLSTQLSIKSKLLGFNINENELKANSMVDFEGNFNLSSFRNLISLEFRVTKYTPSK